MLNRLNKHSGFTLLEIIIALFIFTIVSLIMTKSLHMILSAQSSTEKTAERLAQLQMTLLLVSRDIEQSIERPISNSEGIIQGSFIGTKESLTFTHSGLANPGGESQNSTLQRVRYQIESTTLYRDTWAQLDQIPHTIPHRRALLSHLKEMHFRYLDRDNVFHLFWPPETEKKQAEKLPRAVEISLTLEQGGNLKQIYLLPQLQARHVSH